MTLVVMAINMFIKGVLTSLINRIFTLRHLDVSPSPNPPHLSRHNLTQYPHHIMFERERIASAQLTSGLRNRIDTHFHTSPLSSQRKDFLALKTDTPIEKKSHFTAEVVGAAAAYEAFKQFERHEIHKGSKPTHARAKEVCHHQSDHADPDHRGSRPRRYPPPDGG